MDYDDFQVEFAPPWLRDGNAERWNRALGLMKQAVVEAAKSAVKARFASLAPLDALHKILEDRNLDPAWNETADAIRSRIRNAWITWALAGTKAGLGEALKLAGYTVYEIREQPQDGTLKWWEFEVWIFPPFPWLDTYLSDDRWGDPGVWSDGGLWSADLPAPDRSRIRLAIRKWKPVHALCRWLVIVHAGETWDFDAPPGTWDDIPTAIWTDDLSYLSP